ncbi:hypothetical protein O988_02651, partial [Pseudogymnoascus sp. VKM F-3808]
RRYNFQLLVERFILQIRYGCRVPYCTTATCFTYRRRVAGAKPIRRYNATSARTLACHLATQDDPESALCPHMNAYPEAKQPGKPPASQHTKLRFSDTKNNADSDGPLERESVDLLVEGSNRRRSSATSERFPRLSSDGQNSGPDATRDKPLLILSREDGQVDDISLNSHLDQQSVKIDPRSFVQNVFNTDAMKMLEWLTPSNFGSLASSLTGMRKFLSSDSASNPTRAPDVASHGEAEPKRDGQPTLPTLQEGDVLSPLPSSESPYKPKSGTPNATNDGTGVDRQSASGHSRHRRRSDLATSPPPPAFKPLNSAVLPEVRRRDSGEHDKSVKLHRGSSFSEDGVSQHRRSSGTHSSHGSITPKKTRIGLSPSIKPSPTFASHETPLSTPRGNELPSSKTSNVAGMVGLGLGDDLIKDTPIVNANEKAKQESQPSESEKQKDENLPQSLSILTIQSIELMCNILMADGIINFEKGGIASMDEARLFKNAISLPPKLRIMRQPNTAAGWKSFAEQSLFYVLSDRKALIESFSTEENGLLDSGTLTYCLGRISRVGFDVLFDSLWSVAADLYDMPRQLSDIQDVGKQLGADSTSGSATTKEEASKIMIICLHALVAAVPYPHDLSVTRPATHSRGKGLSYARHYPYASDYTLALDDVLSNEMALKLARRLFAAISARRRFQELERLNNWESAGPTQGTDILDDVLESLESFDIERSSPSPETERLHDETRSATILIDWARTVILQDWKATAVVPADGTFGGALALIKAIYDRRKQLLLTEQNFRAEFFADRLDSAEMPLEWLTFTPNRKSVHLLDYPFLFSKASLVTYFRAINFSRMSGAFDYSATMNIRVNSIAYATPWSLVTDPSRRDHLNEKLRVATSKFLVLQIRRSHVLVDAFDKLWRREERELLRPLKIKLGEEAGEEGSDSGGVQQEFFRLAIAEALNPDYGAFTIDERTKMIWFQASSPEPLWKFELIGLLVGLAIYNGLTLPVTFPKVLYRKLLNQPVTELHHIEDGWPELAAGLTSLLEWDEKDGLVSDIFCRTYEFSADVFGAPVSIDMSAPKPSPWPQFASLSHSKISSELASEAAEAPLVDASNRNDYVSDYISHLTTHSVAPQFSAFQRGFLTCLEPRSLALFTPSLLQSTVEGVQDIDIADLRRYARYVGWDAEHRAIKDFWAVVRRFGTEEKKRLLEFVTASDRVPVGGMRNLVFVVQRNGEGEEGDVAEEEEGEGTEGHVGRGRLPTSYTCYGTLLLPEYKDRETLKRKLGMALENAKGSACPSFDSKNPAPPSPTPSFTTDNYCISPISIPPGSQVSQTCGGCFVTARGTWGSEMASYSSVSSLAASAKISPEQRGDCAVCAVMPPLIGRGIHWAGRENWGAKELNVVDNGVFVAREDDDVALSQRRGPNTPSDGLDPVISSLDSKSEEENESESISGSHARPVSEGQPVARTRSQNGYGCDDIEAVDAEPKDDPFLVGWDGGDADPLSPRSRSGFQKWTIVLINSVAAGSVTCVSSIYTATYEQILPEFHTSRIVATVGLSLFIFGLGCGPMLLAPLSEFYGRRPIYLVSFAFFIIWIIPSAVAQNMATLLVSRFFDGFSGSAFLSVAGGSVYDLYSRDNLQAPMMVFTASPFIGPVLGPLVGGFINQYTHWRWTYYVLIIWNFVLWVLIILFVPETYHPVLLRNKARKIRADTGDDRYKAPMELSTKSIPHEIRISLYRPFQLLALEFMVLNLCVFSGFLLGILYLFFGAFPLVFRNNHDFTLSQIGLTFLGLLVGMLIALATDPFWYKNYRRLVEKNKDNGGAEPEHRLPPAIAGSILVPAGIFMFGWTTYRSVHWIVPIIGSTIFAIGNLLVFTGIFTFLVDAYPQYAASSLAANSFVRSSFAAVFPLFGVQMYNKLGYQWATSVLAFLTVAMMPFPYLFFKYGKRIRGRSRFAKPK